MKPFCCELNSLYLEKKLYYKLSNYSFYTKMNILKAWSDNSA